MDARACGRSVVAAQKPSKLLGRVRFPSPAFLPRGVAQSGSAPGWGPGGRRFKSCLPDQQKARVYGPSVCFGSYQRRRWGPIWGPMLPDNTAARRPRESGGADAAGPSRKASETRGLSPCPEGFWPCNLAAVKTKMATRGRCGHRRRAGKPLTHKVAVAKDAARAAACRGADLETDSSGLSLRRGAGHEGARRARVARAHRDSRSDRRG
jgi:hypothetical protein